MTALQMNLPMVTLKKQTSKILNGEVYQTTVHSFTKNSDYELTLSKNYINSDDNVLIIDDFLANGEAALGAARLIEEAGAKGYDVYALARIARLDEGVIEFLEE